MMGVREIDSACQLLRWKLAQGLTAAATAEWSGTRTLSDWADFRADWGFPPALDQSQQEELKGVVQQPPATSGIELANWYWKVVRQYVSERCGVLSRSSCLNYLHRLIRLQAPQEAPAPDAEKREAFVVE